MKIKERIASWLFKEFKPVNDKYLNALFRNMLRSGNLLDIQDKAESYIDEGYQGNADVYSIIRKHVTMSTQAKLVLRKKNKFGEWDDVTDHELLKFTEKVNPQTTFEQFRESYIIYLLTTGNSFWYKPTIELGVNKGKTNEIYTLPSDAMEIIQGTNKITAPVAGYKLTGSTTEFTGNEVYHAKYFNQSFYTDQTLFGQSPLMAAKYILAKQNEASKTESRQFENQGPAYLIFRDSENAWNILTPEQKEELTKELNDAKKLGNRGGIMALKEKMNVIKLGVSAADLNIIESTKDGRRVLANVYQFPVSLLNETEGSTYNNMKEARKAAWTDALKTLNDNLANGLNMFIIDPVLEYKDYRYFMDYSNVEELQENLSEKVIWMNNAKWTGNEIRQATGKEAIQDESMDQPLFNQGQILLNELNFDPTLENKNLGDYKT